MTPARLAKIYPKVKALCFRGCKLLGTIAHVWWECPRIRTYWKRIFNLIKGATGERFPGLPSLHY